MAWNHPGNNGHDRDPWGNSNNKGRRKQGMPNLDDIDIFRNLSNRLKWRGSKNTNETSTSVSGRNGRYFALVIAVVVVIWISSGFYTIKEAERGVVLRFGQFNHLVQPGLNWKPTFIDTVTAVDVESVRELIAAGIMLTSDVNVVRVEINVQYRVIDPERYLFSVSNADNSLRLATDSALRGVIGKYTMDRILTEGRTVIRNDTQHVLAETIQPYNMGINLLDVNFQSARPPEEVKAAFDDAIAARENEQQYIREAEAYANEVQPQANGQAQRILEEGRAYTVSTVLEAQGDVERFSKLLPEYKAAPEITRERLYIEAMERILSNTRKILVHNNSSNNMMVLPLEQLWHHQSLVGNTPSNLCSSKASNMLPRPADSSSVISQTTGSAISSHISETVMNQRVANTQRDDTTRDGRRK